MKLKGKALVFLLINLNGVKKQKKWLQFLWWLCLYIVWVMVFQKREFAFSRTATVELCYLIFIAANFYFNVYFYSLLENFTGLCVNYIVSYILCLHVSVGSQNDFELITMKRNCLLNILNVHLYNVFIKAIY